MGSPIPRTTSQRLPLALATHHNVYIMMRNTADQLLKLPQIGDSQIPDLPTHIAAVKNDAQWFISTMTSQMTEWCNVLTSYGDKLARVSDQALTLLRGTDQRAVALARQTLQPILAEGEKVENALNTFNSHLADYSNRIAGDTRNFAVDQQRAEQILTTDNARLTALSQRYRALQEELANKRINEIILGIFTFGIGAAIMELTGYIESTERDIANAQQQTDKLQHQMAQLSACYSILRSFLEGSSIMSGLTLNMQTEWQTLSASLQEAVTHPVPAEFLQANILAILKDWQLVSDQLAQLRP